MKQLISFRMSFIILATFAVAMVSCSKATPDPKPNPVDTTHHYSSPKISNLKAETAWYSSGTNITWTTTDATTVTVNPAENPIIPTGTGSWSYPTSPLTNSVKYTINATGQGGTVSQDIMTHTFSQGNTNLCKDKSWKITYEETQQIYPFLGAVTNTTPTIVDIYKWFPSGDTMHLTRGPGSSNPGAVLKAFGKLINNDNSLIYSLDTFKILTNNGSILKLQHDIKSVSSPDSFRITTTYSIN